MKNRINSADFFVNGPSYDVYVSKNNATKLAK